MKEKNNTTESAAPSSHITTPFGLLSRVKGFLKARDVTGYVVGGYVRDGLLGRPTADIDIAIDSPALEIARAFADATGGRFIRLDEANAIARVVMLPGHEVVDFSSLRGDIKNDLMCRDFTIDAMAVRLDSLVDSPGDIPIVDPWGGRQDLDKHLLKAVTGRIFQDDPARLLRAVRLAAEYDLSVDGGTEELIKASCHLISKVAGERVREELIQLLALPRASKHLAYMDRLGLLLALIPEIAATKGATQPPEHFWHVFEHLLKTVEAIEAILMGGERRELGSEIGELTNQEILSQVPWSEMLTQHFNQNVGTTPRKTLLKLACLLHDIGKPQMRSVELTGRIRFLGHAQAGAKTTVTIMERWRFSNRETNLVEGMVMHHMRPVQMSQGDEMPSRRAIYRYFRDAGEAAIDTLFLSLADHWATRGPELISEGWKAHTNLVRYALEEHFKEESTTRPPRLLDGNDIMAIFGTEPGPALGRLLEGLKEAQAAGEVTTREEALEWVRQYLTDQQDNSKMG